MFRLNRSGTMRLISAVQPVDALTRKRTFCVVHFTNTAGALSLCVRLIGDRRSNPDMPDGDCAWQARGMDISEAAAM